MDNFEEAIAAYTQKKESVITEYTTMQINTRTIDIRKYKGNKILPPGCTNVKPMRDTPLKRCRVITPDGIYESVIAAAEFYGVTPAAIAHRCGHWTKHNFYYEDINE